MVNAMRVIGAGLAIAAAGCALEANAADPSRPGGQVMCADRTQLLADFKDSYKEERGALGVTDSGQLLEVLIGPKGTWTMLVTPPHGPSCVVATGQSWEGAREPGDYGVSAGPGDGRMQLLGAPPADDDDLEVWHTGR